MSTVTCIPPITRIPLGVSSPEGKEGEGGREGGEGKGERAGVGGRKVGRGGGRKEYEEHLQFMTRNLVS